MLPAGTQPASADFDLDLNILKKPFFVPVLMTCQSTLTAITPNPFSGSTKTESHTASQGCCSSSQGRGERLAPPFVFSCGLAPTIRDIHPSGLVSGAGDANTAVEVGGKVLTWALLQLRLSLERTHEKVSGSGNRSN